MDLEHIKKTIENMNTQHHIEILKIMKKNNNVKINENKSGVYINLSFLPKETLDDVVKYVDYICEQEKSLQSLETQKQEFKVAFFIENEKEPKE